MPSISLESILGQVDQFTGQAVKAGNELWNLNLDAAVSHSDDAATQTEIGANTAIITNAKLSADMATQTARTKGALALGTDLRSQGELISGLSDNILDLMSQRDAVSKTIQQKKAVGLFDDPLQWIFNQVTISDDLEKHAGIEARLDEQGKNLSTLNTLTQQTIQTQNALTAPITEAGMVAANKNVIAAATLQATASQRAALASNASGITAALNVSKEVLASQFQSLNAQNTQTNIGLAQAHLALDQQRFDWQKDEKKIADAARNKQTSVEGYMMEQVNQGLVLMGMQPIPADSPRAGAIMMNLKSGSPSAALFAEAFNVATRSEAAGAKIFAGNPAQAIELLDRVPVPMNGAQVPVKNILNSAVQQVKDAAAAGGGTINLKDPAVRAQALNNAATKILIDQNKKVLVGDSDNVFNIPPIAAIIAASPEAQKLPIVEKVIAPAIAAGTVLSDPNQVFALTVAALASKKITYPEALELTSLYQRGVKVNLEARELQAFGLNLEPKKPGDPSLFSYNVPIQVSNSGSKQVVDLTKPDLLGRALNKYLAGQATRQFSNRLD